jgi:PAS domain S-box-containing protein
VLVVPVFYEQRMAAAIILQSYSDDAFASPVIEFLESLADQTALAVGNAQRYQEQLRRGELVHHRAEQMSLLLEISRTIRSDRPLADILSDVSYAVQEGTRFDIVLISVLEGNLLCRVAGAGLPLVELEKRKEIRLPWDRVRRLCQEQFRIGQCYYIPQQHRALTDGLDVFVFDTAVVPDGLGRWQLEDFFFVVLKGSAGNPIGIMSVDMPRDGLVPTAMTAEVVELFAAQVTQVIENHRLVEDLRRQVTTLQLFNELSRSIATKLDLPLVLNTVVQSVTNLLDYDYSTIFLADNNGEQFIPMASSGYALDYVIDAAASTDLGFITDVVRTAMPLVVENAPADSRYAAWRVPVGSAVAVPLGVEGRTVGVLTADRKETGNFSPAEVATLTALADQVAVAVDNVRLFEEVKRFNEELENRVAERTQELAEALERLRFQRDRSEILYRIASELVASLDMDRVLSQALMLLQRAVHASRSSVILLDNNTGQLFYRASIGHTQPVPAGGQAADFGPGEGLVGWVLQKREALVIPDILEDMRFSLESDDETRSVMAVPILGGGGVSLGVILLQSPILNVFDETQLRLVEAAGVQLGNALNNAELYRLIREQAERLGAMLRAQQIDAAKTQAILEGIADGVMVADASGRVILFNVAAERILSITREQALGRSQDEIFGLYGSEIHEWMSKISVWRDNPQDYGTQAYLAHRLEVQRRFVSIHLSPVLSEISEFLGVVSVFRDITAEIEADRAKAISSLPFPTNCALR